MSEVECGASCGKSIGKLAAALAKAQGEFKHADKDAVNPHFKAKYADLASVFSACREVLAKNELAVLQPVSSDGSKVMVKTILAHSSGEFVEETLTLNPANATPQAFGSAISYGRRYSLASMLGIAADDDDGNAATGLTPQGKEAAEPQTKKPRGKTSSQDSSSKPSSDDDSPLMQMQKFCQGVGATGPEDINLILMAIAEVGEKTIDWEEFKGYKPQFQTEILTDAKAWAKSVFEAEQEKIGSPSNLVNWLKQGAAEVAG